MPEHLADDLVTDPAALPFDHEQVLLVLMDREDVQRAAVRRVGLAHGFAVFPTRRIGDAGMTAHLDSTFP